MMTVIFVNMDSLRVRISERLGAILTDKIGFVLLGVDRSYVNIQIGLRGIGFVAN